MKQRSLFSDPKPAIAVPIAYIDGGARGNPGPAAYGVIIRDPEGKTSTELGQYLGIQTNNFAEYSALLAALEYSRNQNFPGLKVFSDSELLVKQMNGQYKVANPELKKLFSKAQELARGLKHFSVQHVLRSYNREADRLVNQVLDDEERKRRR